MLFSYVIFGDITTQFTVFFSRASEIYGQLKFIFYLFDFLQHQVQKYLTATLLEKYIMAIQIRDIWGIFISKL